MSANLTSITSSQQACAPEVSRTSAERNVKQQPAAGGSKQQQQQQSAAGRTTTFIGLVVASILLLFADLFLFARDGADQGLGAAGLLADFLKPGASGSCATEFILFSVVAVFAGGKYLTDQRRAPVSSKVPHCGGHAASTRSPGPRCSDATSRQQVVQKTPSESPAARKAPNPEVAKFNQAIDLAARQGNAEEAGKLLLGLERSGQQPESVSYNLVIRACAKRGDVAEAERWLHRMEERGVPSTSCTYNTLLDGCAKSDRAEACEKWFKRMQDKGIEPNVISYATVIYARARRGDVAASEAWLQKMLAAGIEGDAVSFNSLIHACSVKGDAVRAGHWLEEMRSRGLETSVSTYTAVVDACAKAADVENAERWLGRMLELGVTPNVVTYSALIDACAKAGNLARAEHWHDQMTSAGIQPNAHSYSAVINACAKQGGEGGAEAAERWLNRAEQAGVVLDVVLYSSVVDACGKAGDAERALRVFRRLRASGLKPHIVAYAALARPFAYRGDWVKVESLAQNMIEDGVKTNEYFIYAQLLAYAVARPRQADKAEACFRAALASGVQPNDHVVGVLARAVGRPRCESLMQELCKGRELPPSPQGRRSAANAGGAQQQGARPRRAP